MTKSSWLSAYFLTTRPIVNRNFASLLKHDLVGFPLLGVSSNDASQYMLVTRSSKAKFMPYITVGVCRDLKRADH